jgi:hypothetical protein
LVRIVHAIWQQSVRTCSLAVQTVHAAWEQSSQTVGQEGSKAVKQLCSHAVRQSGRKALNQSNSYAVRKTTVRQEVKKHSDDWLSGSQTVKQE